MKLFLKFTDWIFLIDSLGLANYARQQKVGFKNRILYKEKNKNDEIWIKPVGKDK